MEDIIRNLPKPLLALIVLVIAAIFFMVANPPHTICDTQSEVFKEAQKGNIFPNQVQVKNVKQKIPAQINQVKEGCQLGNSAGACYDYFTALKNIAVDIGKSSSECMGTLIEIPEAKKAIVDGIEVMARLAWGHQPPELGPSRFGWLQDSEVAVFCRLKNIYIRGVGEDSWTQLRRNVYSKLPGENIIRTDEPEQIVKEPKAATAVMTEEDIWARSLFSARCESYL